MPAADDPTLAPPEVLRALGPLPPGGPWEGSAVDQQGRRWTHYPWRGWRPTGPPPYFAPRGRVYTSNAARRARRRARWRARWVGGLELLLAGALGGLAVVALVLAWPVLR